MLYFSSKLSFPLSVAQVTFLSYRAIIFWPVWARKRKEIKGNCIVLQWIKIYEISLAQLRRIAPMFWFLEVRICAMLYIPAYFPDSEWREMFSPIREEKPASLVARSPVKAGQDRYSCIAGLDQQMDITKWEERTAAITDPEHCSNMLAAAELIQVFVCLCVALYSDFNFNVL